MSARILIIDDNVSLTTLLAKTLVRFGYEPHTENNSLQAIASVERLRPDVVLLDVMMPEKDGGAVLNELRAHPELHHTPVILLTGLPSEAEAICRTNGFPCPIVAKPVELKILVTEIEGLVGIVQPIPEREPEVAAANGANPFTDGESSVNPSAATPSFQNQSHAGNGVAPEPETYPAPAAAAAHSQPEPQQPVAPPERTPRGRVNPRFGPQLQMAAAQMAAAQPTPSQPSFAQQQAPTQSAGDEPISAAGRW